MTDKPAKFSDVLRQVYELRALIRNRLWGSVHAHAMSLEGALQAIPECPAIVKRSANPDELIDAVIAQGEAGSAAGMVLEMRELMPLLDRIAGDLADAKHAPVTESQARNGGD